MIERYLWRSIDKSAVAPAEAFEARVEAMRIENAKPFTLADVLQDISVHVDCEVIEGVTTYVWSYPHPAKTARTEATFSGSRSSASSFAATVSPSSAAAASPSSENSTNPDRFAPAPTVQPTIMFFHGGGYIEKPLRWHFRALEALGRATGARIIMPAYPLIPATARDAYDALLPWYTAVIRSGLVEKPIDGAIPHLTFLGDSAGGGMTFGLAHSIIVARTSDSDISNLPLPAQLIGWSPWVDVTSSAPGMGAIEPIDPMLDITALRRCGEAWAGDEDIRAGHISPLFSEHHAEFPTTRLFVGTHEVFLPEVTAMYNALRTAGTEVTLHVFPGQNHDFQMFPCREGSAARTLTGEFITAA